jgi:hypothetical protein
MRAWLMVSMLLLSLFVPSQGQAQAVVDEELEDRRRMRARVEAWFNEGNYSAIEGEYADALRTQERLPSGVWKATRIMYSLLVFRVAYRAPSAATEAAQTAHVAYHQKLLDWRAQHPASTLAAHLLALHHIDVAFAHRGTGLSSQVTEEGWRQFHSEIASGMKLLTDTALPRDPVWYWAALRVSSYGRISTPDYLALLEEGTRRYPNAYDIYFASIPRLQPKWGGSTELYAYVADLAVRNTKEQDGTSAYARVYWSVAETLGFDNFEEAEVDWPKMRDSFRDLVARRPALWNINAFARFACLSGDAGTVTELVKAHGKSITFLGLPPQRAARCRNLEVK